MNQEGKREMQEFNRLSSPIELLLTRRSGKARDLVEPGPGETQLSAILSAAIRVPDHGKLAPWRFLVVPAGRRAALADLIEGAYVADKPSAGEAERRTMRDFAHQAPALVVAFSCVKRESHIPAWEQELSMGAACQNLMLAAHAQGYAANWLTGWPAYSEAVAAGLGAAPGERIAGFFFIGTPSRALEERPRPDPAQVIAHW